MATPGSEADKYFPDCNLFPWPANARPEGCLEDHMDNGHNPSVLATSMVTRGPGGGESENTICFI